MDVPPNISSVGSEAELSSDWGIRSKALSLFETTEFWVGVME